MSIDKTVKSDKVELTTTIWFGIFKGSIPSRLIKNNNIEGIKYLLWMRTVRNEKGFPRFMFSADLHHVLDQILRLNQSMFNDYTERYSVTDYNVWLAERRVQKKKEEARKEEEIKRKREEMAKFQEQERLKSLELKRQQEIYLTKRRHEMEMLKNLEADRAANYESAWGAW